MPALPGAAPGQPALPPPTPRLGSPVLWSVVAVLVVAVGVLVGILVTRGGSSTPDAGTIAPAVAASSPSATASEPSTPTEAPTSDNSEPAAGQSAPRWQTYRNPSYGFSFELPGSYQASVGGGETVFYDSRGELSVTVFDAPRRGLGAERAFASARRNFIAEGGRVTYHYQDDDEYVLSGYTADDDVFYQFRYFGRAGIGGFTYRYPHSYPRGLAKRSEAAITRAYNTFHHRRL
jgi:hypothetical protein